MNICFLGPEGSGKGTQAALLAKELGIPHVVSGDILRSRREEQSEVGEKIREVFSQGKYLPDEMITEIILNHLQKPDCVNGFVVDGYPRSVGQAKSLDAFLENQGKKLNHAILLQISETETLKRLADRGRFDDTPEKILGRLASYHAEADAMIRYYRERKVLVKIDAEKPVELLHQEIIETVQLKP